jgi:hypothetical protein
MQSFWYLILYKWWKLSPKAHYELLFDAQKCPTETAWGLIFALFVGLLVGFFLVSIMLLGWSLEPDAASVGALRFGWADLFWGGLVGFIVLEMGYHFGFLLFLAISVAHILKSENEKQADYWARVSKYNLTSSVCVSIIGFPGFLFLGILWVLAQAVMFILCKIFEPILYRKMLLFKPETLLFDANQLDVLDEHFVKKDKK